MYHIYFENIETLEDFTRSFDTLKEARQSAAEINNDTQSKYFVWKIEDIYCEKYEI